MNKNNLNDLRLDQLENKSDELFLLSKYAETYNLCELILTQLDALADTDDQAEIKEINSKIKNLWEKMFMCAWGLNQFEIAFKHASLLCKNFNDPTHFFWRVISEKKAFGLDPVPEVTKTACCNLRYYLYRMDTLSRIMNFYADFDKFTPKEAISFVGQDFCNDFCNFKVDYNCKRALAEVLGTFNKQDVEAMCEKFYADKALEIIPLPIGQDNYYSCEYFTLVDAYAFFILSQIYVIQANSYISTYKDKENSLKSYLLALSSVLKIYHITEGENPKTIIYLSCNNGKIPTGYTVGSLLDKIRELRVVLDEAIVLYKNSLSEMTFNRCLVYAQRMNDPLNDHELLNSFYGNVLKIGREGALQFICAKLDKIYS